MSACFFASLPAVGPGDLLVFRDAAITYSACRRHGGRLRLQACPEAWPLLDWLGLEGDPGEPQGTAYLDPSRLVGGLEQRRELAPWSPPMQALSDYLEAGFLGETLFAALVRSSYGPLEGEFFPTRAELGYTFDDSQLRAGPALWEEGYLKACQAFFMEELTPAELVEKALARFPSPQRQALQDAARGWLAELHGVTFRVAAELGDLRGLSSTLQALLQPGPLPQLEALLAALPSWEPAAWESAWSELEGEARHALAASLCPGLPQHASEILYTAGPQFLTWRCGSSGGR